MANWLLVYVSIMIGFTFVRLLRLPVMRLFSHKWYMFYVVFYTVAQFITVVVWFVKGNIIKFKSVNQEGCDVYVAGDPALTEKLAFNPLPMQILMLIIILFHWFLIFFVI